MDRSWRVLNLMVALALTFPSFAAAQSVAENASGIFQGSTDIGATQKGSTAYDPATDRYRITGGGADMWGTADAFRFSWMRLSGDASITADVHFDSSSPVPLEKGVLIFRESLDPASAYADVAIHGDGHITLQYRKSSGAATADQTSTVHGSVRIRIERKGNQFTGYAQSTDGKMIAFGSTTIALQDPVYVGLGVCSHNQAGVSSVTFSQVNIEQGTRSTTGRK
jgi:TolB protein